MSCAPDILGKTTCRAVAACLFAACSLLILPTGVAAQGVTVVLEAVDSVGQLPVLEGGSAQYTVVLDTAPAVTEEVRITVGRSGDDADLTASPEELRFTNSNWNTPKTVTVSAEEDDDGANGVVTFTHSASSSDTNSDYHGILISNVTATEDDNDSGVTVVPDGGLSVAEGGSAQYTIVLDAAPAVTEEVTITLGRSGSAGDADLTVSPMTLTFKHSNWDTPQTVTVSAKEDDDGAHGIVTFTHSVTSSDTNSNYHNIGVSTARVVEVDNDRAGHRPIWLRG